MHAAWSFGDAHYRCYCRRTSGYHCCSKSTQSFPHFRAQTHLVLQSRSLPRRFAAFALPFAAIYARLSGTPRTATMEPSPDTHVEVRRQFRLMCLHPLRVVAWGPFFHLPTRPAYYRPSHGCWQLLKQPTMLSEADQDRCLNRVLQQPPVSFLPASSDVFGTYELTRIMSKTDTAEEIVGVLLIFGCSWV